MGKLCFAALLLLHGPMRSLPAAEAATVTVSDVANLVAAVNTGSVSRIILATGTYTLTAELLVARTLTLEAAVPGSVVLDASASAASPRRVLRINPSSTSDVVALIGLDITGGYTESTDSGITQPGEGGGIFIQQGQVTFSQVKIYSNKARIGAGLYFKGNYMSSHIATYGSDNFRCEDCDIYSNECVLGASNGNGGGVMFKWGHGYFERSRIYSNECAMGAGMMFQGSPTTGVSKMTLQSCDIFSNSAYNQFGSHHGA